VLEKAIGFECLFLVPKAPHNLQDINCGKYWTSTENKKIY